LENYETKGITIGACVELDETDDLVECKAELTTKLNKLLEEEVSREKQKLLVAVSR